MHVSSPFAVSRPVSSTLTRRDALRSLGLAGAALAFSPAGLRAENLAAEKTPEVALAAQTGFYRFKIGAHEAIALSDGGFGGPAAKMTLWRDRSADELTDDLRAAFLGDQIRLPFCVLLVRLGADWVLIDSGAGGGMGASAGRLLPNLAAAGVAPEKISAVILTHAHGDHFGGLLDPESKKPVFKNARHLVHADDHAYWTSSAPDLSRVGVSPEVRRQWIASAQAVLGGIRFEKIRGGEKLFDGLEIIDAPGHTPGHLALLIASGDEQLLHLVDAVHHHLLSFAHPDWEFAFDSDPQQAIATRQRLLDRAAADRLRVFGAHLPFPALGHVRIVAKNRYEHVPEPWVSA
jgi:glyoxylase-like metal-dependent hydrolase (beta-lactamase superfamily II)